VTVSSQPFITAFLFSLLKRNVKKIVIFEMRGEISIVYYIYMRIDFEMIITGSSETT
jgi:hypothetical protein